MLKNIFILMMLSLASTVLADDAAVLIDGTALAGAYGRLVAAEPNAPGEWAFKLDDAISDGKNTLAAGTTLNMLQCSTLEVIIKDAARRQQPDYRIWGSVTTFQNENYIYAIYYLPLSKLAATEPNEVTAEPVESKGPAINEANDIVTIPAELLKKINNRPVIQTEQLVTGLEIDQDSILSDRSGRFRYRGDGKLEFTLDGLGRNVQDVSFELLPSEALDMALRELSRQPEKLRFRVTGMLTRFEGNYYLLLNKAVRIYSHGNFSY